MIQLVLDVSYFLKEETIINDYKILINSLNVYIYIISLTIYVKIADLIHVKKTLKAARAPTFCGIVAELI